LVAGETVLDQADERVLSRGKPVRLGGKAFLLLKTLMERPLVLVTKDDLFEAAWPDLAVSESVLTTAVKEIRKAIGDNARAPRIIETVHGRGYRFLLNVDSEDDVAAPEVRAAGVRRRLQ